MVSVDNYINMNKETLLKLLLKTKAETNSYFDLAENDLSKKYGQDKWNIRQILHHLTDTEMIFHGRLKKIIAESKQVIWAFNQDRWNDTFDYENAPLINKKQVFHLCRELNYELIDKYYNDYYQKEFVHNETGLRSLKDEFEKVALHNQAHLEQINMALSM